MLFFLGVQMHSDISKFEDILKDYTNFNEFLLKLSPPEWQEKQQWRREMAQKIRAREKQQQTAAKAVQGTAPTTQSRRTYTLHQYHEMLSSKKIKRIFLMYFVKTKNVYVGPLMDIIDMHLLE